MKITVYTTSDCQFSKQEKEYLAANKLIFEEKNLETNKDFLTEMLAVSNNFAGTPVTRVEKDDGTIAVLKGFTKEEFDTTFGFSPTTTNADVQTPNLGVSTNTNSAPINDTPIPPPTETPTPPKTDSTVSSDPLKSVMDDLQSKSQVVEPVAPPIETPAAEVTNIPTDQANPTGSTAQTPPPVDLPKVPEPDFK